MNQPDLSQGRALCAQLRALEAQMHSAYGEDLLALECEWMYVWRALNEVANRDFP